MGLQADDDEILMSKLGWIVGAARVHHALLVTNQQFEPMSAHRGEMRPSCDETDVGARACKLHAQISADRACAVDTDFHEASPGRVLECRHELPSGLETLPKPWVKVAERKWMRQAGTACAAAMASSSNAVEISRMLITPHRE